MLNEIVVKQKMYECKINSLQVREISTNMYGK